MAQHDGTLEEKSDSDLHVEVFNEKPKAIEIVAENGQTEFDPKEVQRILRKIDLRLLPVLTALYLMSFLDRSNIGNANVAGLSEDLRLSSKQYNLCLTIFFFPYALFEVPSNIVLKWLRPTIWLPIIVLCWGTVMTLMGIVQGYSGLLAARFFLGVAEAGLFPAASYMLTTWYCRHEMQTRLAIFYCAATMAGAFSGLLAFAIEKMNGVAGLEGWRWIFILEGLLTVLLGLLLPFLLHDHPEKARFLTRDERSFHVRRLQIDYSNGATDQQSFKWKYLTQALTDWKIYLSVLVFWGNTITGYGFIFSLPTAIKDLGYSQANAQLLTIPVYTFALIWVLVTARFADRTKQRAPFVIYPYMVCAVGFIITMALPKDKWPGARYAMLFIIASGLYPPLVGIVAWNANNLAGSWKRAIGVALQITLGNLGGAVGSNIYLKPEAPYYYTGYGVSLAVLVLAIVAGFALRFGLERVNRKREGRTDEDVRVMYSEAELQDMGDESPLFRYTL